MPKSLLDSSYFRILAISLPDGIILLEQWLEADSADSTHDTCK